MTREDAEKVYDSLDDEQKRLAGVFGCFAAGRFASELLSIVLRISSGMPDDHK